MATKILTTRHDSNGMVSVTATVMNGDVLILPPLHKYVWLQVSPAATARTVTISARIGGTASHNALITRDVNGVTYPFVTATNLGYATGFRVLPGAAVTINATMTTAGKMYAESSE
jgi:hypothetical protein